MGRGLFFNFLTMLISPVVGLIPAFSRNYDTRLRKWTIILFITFFGSVLVIGEGSDAGTHLGRVKKYYLDLSLTEFVSGARDIVLFIPNENIQDDLYIHIISFVSGSLFGLPWLFFIIACFIYGYFYTSSLFKLINFRPDLKYTYTFYFLLFILIIWRGIENVGSIRTWTGLMVLFYGVIGYYTERKLKYIILICLTPYIHFSYFIMALPTVFVLLVGFRARLYILLYIISFFTNFLNPEVATEQAEGNEIAESKVAGYYVDEQEGLTEKYSKNSKIGATWYRAFSKSGLHNWGIYILSFIIIVWGYFPDKMTRLENGLFSIGLLTKVLSSSTWFIYALTNRSSFIAGIFILAAFFLMAQRGAFINKNPVSEIYQKFFFHIALLLFVPFIVERLSDLFGFFSFFLLSTPFLVWFSGDVNVSLKDAFKTIIGVN